MIFHRVSGRKFSAYDMSRDVTIAVINQALGHKPWKIDDSAAWPNVAKSC